MHLEVKIDELVLSNHNYIRTNTLNMLVTIFLIVKSIQLNSLSLQNRVLVCSLLIGKGVFHALTNKQGTFLTI